MSVWSFFKKLTSQTHFNPSWSFRSFLDPSSCAAVVLLPSSFFLITHSPEGITRYLSERSFNSGVGFKSYISGRWNVSSRPNRATNQLDTTRERQLALVANEKDLHVYV